MTKKFDVSFHPAAEKEYSKLDNSVKKIVARKLIELESRADEIGKDLENKNVTKLYGYKELKFKDAGIRVIYQVTNQVVNVLRIVYIIAVSERSDEYVFKLAQKRIKSMPIIDVEKDSDSSPKIKGKKK